MRLKKSFYNIEVDKFQDNILIFNSRTSALGLMDRKTQNIYNNIENIENWKALDDEEARNNINIMIQNGFLVSSDLDETAALNVLEDMQKYNPSILSLVIAPTLNCNMACPYCYENKNHKRFDSDTKKSMIDFVRNYVNRNLIKTLSITWYGGEPLMEKDTIKELSEAFKQICEDKTVHYIGHIVTNGSLLDYETGLMLKEAGVKMAQITVDGMEEINNQRRILKNGQNSFEIIVNNIKSCQDLFKISVRVNIDKSNEKEAEKLYKFFTNKENFGENVRIYFAQVKKMSDSCSISSHQCFSNKEFGDLEIELLNKINSGANSSGAFNYPNSKILPCAALTLHSFVIDPEGNLYKCWEEIGIIEKSVGSIFEGFKLNNRAVQWLNLRLPAECSACKTRPMCQSGCAYRRIEDGNTPRCEPVTFSYKETLKRYYLNQVQNSGITNSAESESAATV